MSDPTIWTLPTPAARAAITLLDAFGITTVEQADTILDLWSRRDELTDADLATIRAAYEPVRLYTREIEEPTGGPLPDDVEGRHLGGRG